MPLEDFRPAPDGDYVEVDEDGDITVTANKLTIATMRIDALSYVRRDMGAAHFGDFEHHVHIEVTAGDARGRVLAWLLSNTSNTMKQAQDNDDGMGVWLYISSAGTPPYIYVQDWTNDNNDSVTIAFTTDYYLKIKRVGTTLTCDVYDDEPMTNLIANGNLSIVCANTTYRYVFGTASYQDSSYPAQTITYTVEDLDLREGWAGEIGSVVNPAEINSVPYTSIESVNSVGSS